MTLRRNCRRDNMGDMPDPDALPPLFALADVSRLPAFPAYLVDRRRFPLAKEPTTEDLGRAQLWRDRAGPGRFMARNGLTGLFRVAPVDPAAVAEALKAHAGPETALGAILHRGKGPESPRGGKTRQRASHGQKNRPAGRKGRAK